MYIPYVTTLFPFAAASVQKVFVTRETVNISDVYRGDFWLWLEIYCSPFSNVITGTMCDSAYSPTLPVKMVGGEIQVCQTCKDDSRLFRCHLFFLFCISIVPCRLSIVWNLNLIFQSFLNQSVSCRLSVVMILRWLIWSNRIKQNFSHLGVEKIVVVMVWL